MLRTIHTNDTVIEKGLYPSQDTKEYDILLNYLVNFAQ